MTKPVVILGAGPAGSRAALEFVSAGLTPIVIDEQAENGGQVYRRPPVGLARSYADTYGTEHAKAQRLHGDFDTAVQDGRIDFRPGTIAWAIRDNTVFVEKNGRATQVEYDRLLLATGATERVFPIPGWTLPGVFTLGGAQIALKTQGCSVGKEVAFVGTGPLLYLVALQYARAGAKVCGVFDTSAIWQRIKAAPYLSAKPWLFLRGISMTWSLWHKYKIPIFTSVRPREIHGKVRATGFTFQDRAGCERNISCDAIGLGYDLRPEVQLADLAKCDLFFNNTSRNWEVRTDAFGRSSQDGIYVAGDGARIAGADAAEIAGQLAAHAALIDMGLPTRSPNKLLRAAQRFKTFRRGIEMAFPAPVSLLDDVPADTMICRCEGVRLQSYLKTSEQMDVKEINRAKSLTRCGMGRCQGRYCDDTASELLAKSLNTDRTTVGRMRSQAPVKPVPLCKTGDHLDNA